MLYDISLYKNRLNLPKSYVQKRQASLLSLLLAFK
jgi:hypothetical protein